MTLPAWITAVTRVRIWLPVAAIFTLTIAANQWALRHPLRVDLTAAGLYTISPETRRVLDQIREPVRITYFYDLKHRTMQDGKALLAQYAEHAPHISIRLVDPSLQPSVAREYGVMFPGTTVMETARRRITVQGGSETDFTNGLIRVSRESSQRVCFTEGHGEANPESLVADDHAENLAGPGTGGRDDGFGRALQIHERHGMAMARQALATLGYDTRKLLLAREGASADACAVVVVAGAAKPFSARELAALNAYLERGGKLLALLDAADHGLQSVLGRFGIVHDRGLVQDPARHYGTDPGSPAVSDYPRHAVTRNLAMTYFPAATSLRPVDAMPSDVRIVPLLQTSERAGQTLAHRAAVDSRSAPGERLTLAVLASRAMPAITRVDSDGNERIAKAELLAIANAAFASNSHFAVLGNGSLFLNAVNYLAQQEDLIHIAPRNYELPQVKMSNGQMRFTFFFSTLFAPLLVSLVGLAVWWRRRG